MLQLKRQTKRVTEKTCQSAVLPLIHLIKFPTVEPRSTLTRSVHILQDQASCCLLLD